MVHWGNGMERLTKDLAIRLLSQGECKSELNCVEKDVDELCKVMDIGKASYMICLEEEAHCSFAITPFRPSSDDTDSNMWCTCPVRMHIARQYKK